MDRMFHVIVIGGASLVGVSCGARSSLEVGTGANGGGGGAPVSSSSGLGGFPSEFAPPLSTTSSGFTSTTSGFGGFPTEGPVMSVASSSTGFPNETDLAPVSATASSSTGFPQEV